MLTARAHCLVILSGVLINISGNLLAISDNGGFYQGLNRSSSYKLRLRLK